MELIAKREKPVRVTWPLTVNLRYFLLFKYMVFIWHLVPNHGASIKRRCLSRTDRIESTRGSREFTLSSAKARTCLHARARARARYRCDRNICTPYRSPSPSAREITASKHVRAPGEKKRKKKKRCEAYRDAERGALCAAISALYRS